MNISLLTPAWRDGYELIDSGNGLKLERFGNYILSRPEPQALWKPSLPEKQWDEMSNADFIKQKGSEDKGKWHLKKGMPEQWVINYKSQKLDFKMRLGLTSFKHVGIFPEQASNWEFIYDKCITKKNPKVLNLFAYTGGATLAALSANAEVTHIDSVKQTVSWSRENMETSRLDGVRWIVEDAQKFVARECRRGNRYDGIIMDPPSYGRGADGEKWTLMENLRNLLENCAKILSNDGFFILNLYSMGLSPLLAHTLVGEIFPDRIDESMMGELYFEDKFKKKLPLGVFIRF